MVNDDNQFASNSGQRPVEQTPFPSEAGGNSSGPSGITISTAPENDSESDAFQSGVKSSQEPIGNSGTQIFGGYFSEEYLSELRGRQGAKKWDEMRRSEAQISMLLNAICNPIKAANWDVEPYDAADPECVKHAELVKTCFFDMIDFNTFKTEALTVIPFGFVVMEIVHSVEFNHPKFGTFNGLKALSFRSQKTIENWSLEKKTGRLLGVNQYTYSDLGGNEFIPGEFLLVLTHLKEGDNYEGISALRPMLGAYKRKDLYLKLAAIGIERYAIGTPIGTIPKGKEKSLEYNEFKKILQNYTSHECSYIIKPEGWSIEIQKGEFDASKIKELLSFENTEFANALVGNFLALGMNGGGGAYALGTNLGEFFTSGIQSYADLICDGVNRGPIPNLVKLNFGPQRGYPKMKVTGISDKAGKELAEVIKFLTDARALDPDKPLKEHLRKLYKLPKPDLATAVVLPAIPAGGAQNYPTPGEPVVNPTTGNVMHEISSALKLADSQYVKKFDKNKAELKSLMQENLSLIYLNLKDLLRKRYASLKGSEKIMAAKGVEAPGLLAYKSALRELLSQFALETVTEARKQLRLSETATTIKLAAKKDPLSPHIRNLINTQATLVAETQAADIEKITFFQFTSSAASSDDIENILFDVDSKVLPTIEGSTAQGMSVDVAAGDALAHVTQQSSLDTYFEPEVLSTIESFTFTNEDPVSECCQALAGTTFAPGDPDLDTYTPPLHHNCKSRLVVNLIGDASNPEINRDGVSLSKKALNAITLSERIRLGGGLKPIRKAKK